MPVATVSDKTERRDLKSLKDGYVVLRKMSYGEHLETRELAARMTASRQQKGDEVTMAMGVKASTLYNFKHSIVDHNLQDVDGRKLDLGNMQDLAKLDPAVALEIETAVDDLNDSEREEDLRPLELVSEQPSNEDKSVTQK